MIHNFFIYLLVVAISAAHAPHFPFFQSCFGDSASLVFPPYYEEALPIEIPDEYFSLNSSLKSRDKASEGLPLYYWQQKKFVNFGDYLSVQLVERITGIPVRIFRRYPVKKEIKLLAVGSIMSFAANDDIIWGSGITGKCLKREDYHFNQLDIRAVRGPLSRQFLIENFQQNCPEVYGDPILLFPYFFPEFKRKENPFYDYIIIPHFSETDLFPKSRFFNVVYPTDPWEEIIEKILDSRFVISSSLHGIIVAEAYGIPARMLRITENEYLFKYEDYYLGTQRPHFQFAASIEEALSMGGEPPFECDLKKLYEAFPFEFWPNAQFHKPTFPH